MAYVFLTDIKSVAIGSHFFISRLVGLSTGSTESRVPYSMQGYLTVYQSGKQVVQSSTITLKLVFVQNRFEIKEVLLVTESSHFRLGTLSTTVPCALKRFAILGFPFLSDSFEKKIVSVDLKVLLIELAINLIVLFLFFLRRKSKPAFAFYTLPDMNKILGLTERASPKTAYNNIFIL